jgi:hypothetical protein
LSPQSSVDRLSVTFAIAESTDVQESAAQVPSMSGFDFAQHQPRRRAFTLDGAALKSADVQRVSTVLG